LSTMRGEAAGERVLLVGSSRLAQALVTEIGARPRPPYQLAGVVDDGSGPPPDGCPCVGRLEDLRQIVDELRPHRIVLALGSRRGRMPVQQLLDFRLRGLVLEDGAELYERVTGKVAIESLTPSVFIFSRDFRRRRHDRDVGRVAGIALAAAGLILAAPLLALIALAIKLDSPGPVLFVQDRVGLGGRRFRLLKFRTMRLAPSTVSEWVRDNGHRITRTGRWLRKFRLDELPQLVNVLRGDMSLVGPRPHPISNQAMFVVMLRNAPECGERIPYYALRSSVRPGLTGWAQVRYRYANDLEEEIEKMRYDLFYLKHRSLWLDLRIVLETIKIVVLGREQRVEGDRRTEPRVSAERREKSWMRWMRAQPASRREGAA
jgi:exopolysaccharide biosynthesis polyprenyl glycosylphosphotransferase